MYETSRAALTRHTTSWLCARPTMEIQARRHRGLPQSRRCSRRGSTFTASPWSKCSGLVPEQLRRAVPPSSLSLLGLVRHMAEVERNWFRRALANEDAPPHYRSEHDPNGAFATSTRPMWLRLLPPGGPSVRMPGRWSPRSAISTRWGVMRRAPDARPCAGCWCI